MKTPEAAKKCTSSGGADERDSFQELSLATEGPREQQMHSQPPSAGSGFVLFGTRHSPHWGMGDAATHRHGTGSKLAKDASGAGHLKTWHQGTSHSSRIQPALSGTASFWPTVFSTSQPTVKIRASVPRRAEGSGCWNTLPCSQQDLYLAGNQKTESLPSGFIWSCRPEATPETTLPQRPSKSSCLGQGTLSAAKSKRLTDLTHGAKPTKKDTVHVPSACHGTQELVGVFQTNTFLEG